MTRLLSCTRYRKLYSAYRDGDLPPERAAAMEQHLEVCEGCRRRHHALEFGVRLLRALRPDTEAAPSRFEVPQDRRSTADA